jgi:outer membrane protein assembly factor BamD (BamD/ComL family)
MKKWLDELTAYMAEDAYVRAKFYDTRQRTPHAAIASYEQFLAEYPDSSHAEAVSRRIDELRGVKPVEDAEKKGGKE